MVSVSYRISVPRKVVEMLEKANIPLNKDTLEQMAELYVKIKTAVPYPVAEEMVRLYTELEKNGTMQKVWELARRLSKIKEVKSHYEVIKKSVDTYEFLVIRGMKSVTDMIQEFEDFIKTVDNIITNSQEFKSLPEDNRIFVVKSLPYFAFEVLVLQIFRGWIEKNPQKVIEIAKQLFFNKNLKEEDIIGMIDL